MPQGFDVIIVGAGPAGAACAMALKDSGLSVLLADKASFPRDKVCGDAIPHRAVSVLRTLDPEAASALTAVPSTTANRGCRVVAPGGRHVDIAFSLDGYTSPRAGFDDFLFRRAAALPHVTVRTGVAVGDVRIAQEGVEVDAGGDAFTGAMVVGCDGAHSVVQKKTTALVPDALHHSGAVRAYYRGVEDAVAGRMEIHLFREFPAAYFWIFPMGDGLSNVGLGMLTQRISRHRISLNRTLERITGEDGFLKARFATAHRESEVKGFGLPMGSRRVPLSGHRFLLCGDAGSLIDPATGEGIGNAMLSGMLAAGQVKRCFMNGNFSAAAMRSYDDAVCQKLGTEFRRKHRLQRLLSDRPWLADAAVRLAAGNGWVRKQLQRMF